MPQNEPQDFFGMLKKITAGSIIFLFLMFNPWKISKEVAEALNIDESTVRGALHDMTELGILQRKTVEASVGRPPYVYAVRTPFEIKEV